MAQADPSAPACPICAQPIAPGELRLTHEGRPAHSECRLLALQRIATAERQRAQEIRQRAVVIRSVVPRPD
jgi:hypothetical protein